MGTLSTPSDATLATFPLADQLLIYGSLPGVFFRFDPATGQSSLLPPNPAGVTREAALAWDATPGQEQLFVVGGDRPSPKINAIADVLAFSVAKNRWRYLPSLPEPRLRAAAFVRDGRLHVVGGDAQVTTGATDSIFVLDLREGTDARWRQEGFLPEPRSFASVASDGSRFYLVGGTIFGNAGSYLFAENVLVFSSDSTWSTLPGPTPRLAPAALWFCGSLLVAGGAGDPGVEQTFVTLDPSAQRWLPLPSLPAPRTRPSLVPWKGTLLILGSGGTYKSFEEPVVRYAWP